MGAAKKEFKVGDVVINLSDFEFWNNSYHFEKTLISLAKKEVVQQVSYQVFTTDKDTDLDKYEDREDWRKQYTIYGNTSGKSLFGSKDVHNWTTNKANIIAFFKKQFDEALAKCQKDDDNLIARLESEIRAKQAQIEEIRNGNRGILGNSRVNERQFINSQIEAINKIFEKFDEQ